MTEYKDIIQVADCHAENTNMQSHINLRLTR
jgi:hypothetical protein